MPWKDHKKKSLKKDDLWTVKFVPTSKKFRVKVSFFIVIRKWFYYYKRRDFIVIVF
jgi:hypothetical protein